MLWALNREVLWREFWKWKLCNVKTTLILVTWHRGSRYRYNITIVFSFEIWFSKFNYALWQRGDCALTMFLNDSFFIYKRFVNFSSFVNFLHRRIIFVHSTLFRYSLVFEMNFNYKKNFFLISTFFFQRWRVFNRFKMNCDSFRKKRDYYFFRKKRNC